MLFFSVELTNLYRGLIRSGVEYCSHVCPRKLIFQLLSRQFSRKQFTSSNPILLFLSLKTLRFSTILLFSLFYNYYLGLCCEELAPCVPPLLARSRSSLQATTSYRYFVSDGKSRVGLFHVCLIPSTAGLCSSLPLTFLPPPSHMSLSKKRIYHHLNSDTPPPPHHL